MRSAACGICPRIDHDGIPPPGISQIVHPWTHSLFALFLYTVAPYDRANKLSRLRITAPAATHEPRRRGTPKEEAGPISPTSADHHSTAERLGIVVREQPGERVAEIARLAESAGFTHLFLPKMGYAATTRITGRDPFIASATALAATTRLRVGPVSRSPRFALPGRWRCSRRAARRTRAPGSCSAVAFPSGRAQR